MSDSLDSLSRDQCVQLRRLNIATPADLADVLTDADARPRIQVLLELEDDQMTALLSELESRGHDTSLRPPLRRPPSGVLLSKKEASDGE